MIRFLDSGESHGEAIYAIIEGLPSNFFIDEEYINRELSRRNSGYGRGDRMKIERDKVKILSGTYEGKTTGAPVTLKIENIDYKNWKDKKEDKIVIPRPGHGDMVGFYKYSLENIRPVIERCSARETAIRTAVGALCKEMLLKLKIDIRSFVLTIGSVKGKEINLLDDDVYKNVEENSLRCSDKETFEKMKSLIDNAKDKGETLGGEIVLSINGVPMGLGSYVQWDRKLDGILAMGIMSLQGIKAVEFGKGLNIDMPGSTFNDGIYVQKGSIKRRSNNLGGIEGGISNGEPILIHAFMKPIPSVKKDMETVNLNTLKSHKYRYERSDVTAVVPASVVLENICAFHILDEITKKYGGDSFLEIERRMKADTFKEDN